MNILMCTNTYVPHVGGVARSVERFTTELRHRGHEVWVVAPEFENTPAREHGVLRFPAVQHFNGSDFSVPVPVPGRLASLLERFHPDVVHSHHPFLLGDLALRVAAVQNVPMVFTHHTRYELYTHYVPGDSPVLKRFVIELTSGYCNLCDAVIVPSESIEDLLRGRNVTAPMEVIPTGLDAVSYAAASKTAVRDELSIPTDAFVVGHVGRLAAEKNLDFLTQVFQEFLPSQESAHLLVVGEGPSKEGMLARLSAIGLGQRVSILGVLRPDELARVYRAMDVFVFASKTETQGLVLTEAMAAGVPVVALDAPGVREVVVDGRNGYLLRGDQSEPFVEALASIASLDSRRREQMSRDAEKTAKRFSIPALAERVLALYRRLALSRASEKDSENSAWSRARRRFGEEWLILRNVARATADAAFATGSERIDEQPRAMPKVEARAPGRHAVDASAPARRHSIAARVIGLAVSWLLSLQSRTWRIRTEGVETLDAALARGQRVLVVFWHGNYVPLFPLLAGRSACVFTSMSFRGDVIAEICQHFGFDTSQIPDHGGESSFRLMRRALSQSRSGAIAIDGPLGPQHEVHGGAIRLASDLGLPIIPVSVDAERKHVLKKRWDRMQIPAFMTRLYATVGEPIVIPADLTSENVPEWKSRVAAALTALDRITGERIEAARTRR